MTVSPELVLGPLSDMIHPINLQFLTRTEILSFVQEGGIGHGKCFKHCSPVHPQFSAAQLFVSSRQARQAWAAANDGKERFTALRAHQKLVPGPALHLSLKTQAKGHSQRNHIEQMCLDKLRHLEVWTQVPVVWDVWGRTRKVAHCLVFPYPTGYPLSLRS